MSLYFCRMDYPVLEVLAELREKLGANPIVVLQAPPGAGKSTILPPTLLDEPWLGGKKIVMLEPRRLAARAVANRMAALRKEDVGQSVGYRVRFESRISKATRIEVVTEGILTRMLQADNSLEDVGLLIFDEFHERSLQADVALALALQAQQILRADLRILIMSATLDVESLSTRLEAPLIASQGRQYPVEIRYTGGDESVALPARVARVVRKALHEETGDILVFLPGAGEIQRTQALLEAENLSVSLHALFGDMSFGKQQEAIGPHPSGLRKVVLATSIAETSLTIEGVRVVVDSGYARIPRFDPRSGLTRLETVRVTRDAADQRAGRAGRLGPGVCYRLWTPGAHAGLVPHRSPEILDADLASLVLELSQWGVKNVSDLTWITQPPAGAVEQARALLEQLDVLENGLITERGRKMATLPTHPRIAHLLLEGSTNAGTAGLAADIAALLEERDPLPRDSGTDLTLRIELLRRWRKGEKVAAEKNVLDRIERLASSWRRIFKTDVDNSNVSGKDVGALIMAAYPERIARQVEKYSERYKLMNGRIARVNAHDPLVHEPWLAIAQMDAGSGEGKIFLAAPLDEKDLLSRAAETRTIAWDDERGMVTGALEKRLGNLVMAAREIHVFSDADRERVLCGMIRKAGLKVLAWDETLANWQARVLSLRQWRPDDGWPDVSDAALLANLEKWLGPFLVNISKRAELQRLNPLEILPAMLPWPLQNKLDTLAPARITVPSGSSIRLNYFFDGRPPVLEVRLQEVFGLSETPAVNEGRTKIILHLLSPGFKPVQVTQDLKSFWTNTYAEVRKELRARYPKHAWPDDPWTATAVRGAKRRAQ